MAQQDPAYPAVLFVYQGEAEDGADFFARYWPGARAVADLPRTFYTAFGLERGGMRQMLNPEVAVCAVRAAQKGHGMGQPVGDVRQMPGVFLVQGGAVVWRHIARHAGDHPDWAAIPQRVGLARAMA